LIALPGQKAGSATGKRWRDFAESASMGGLECHSSPGFETLLIEQKAFEGSQLIHGSKKCRTLVTCIRCAGDLCSFDFYGRRRISVGITEASHSDRGTGEKKRIG
jgi:hypothetical protein